MSLPTHFHSLQCGFAKLKFNVCASAKIFCSAFVVITSLDMEAMVNTIKGWEENPVKFARSHGIQLTPAAEMDDPESQMHILIVEGFLLYNYK